MRRAQILLLISSRMKKIINNKKRHQNAVGTLFVPAVFFLISSKKSQMPYHASMKVI